VKWCDGHGLKVGYLGLAIRITGGIDMGGHFGAISNLHFTMDLPRIGTTPADHIVEDTDFLLRVFHEDIGIPA